ncbi:hypothetical protein [Effusibacillus consociatus]|uniref:DUF2759 domain-containing protein n=1 Tax=Effusibacillus consociatus TaxID=1117041 RepID=A0ABV9Q2N9_9BACL
MDVIAIFFVILFTIFFLASLRAIIEKHSSFWIFACLAGVFAGGAYWSFLAILGR